jgi:hypothetical protein
VARSPGEAKKMLRPDSCIGVCVNITAVWTGHAEIESPGRQV